MQTKEILETIKMIDEEYLDIRTITMGISVLDCMDTDIDKSCEKDMFAKLRAKLQAEYKPYTDKGKVAAKQRNLQECVTQ